MLDVVNPEYCAPVVDLCGISGVWNCPTHTRFEVSSPLTLAVQLAYQLCGAYGGNGLVVVQNGAIRDHMLEELHGSRRDRIAKVGKGRVSVASPYRVKPDHPMGETYYRLAGRNYAWQIGVEEFEAFEFMLHRVRDLPPGEVPANRRYFVSYGTPA